MPPAQDFILGLANQFVSHTGSWRPLATAVNYLVRIASIMYMASQAWPASPMGVHSDSVMGCDSSSLCTAGHPPTSSLEPITRFFPDTFLNPIKDVFGWLKQGFKQKTPSVMEDLLNLL
ncbi:hypothetical protein DSO57_1034385 [Entomophthora muscae]|uniref:Uncharacterized protein n=1 Tax=Entomophthora muscae TaxID=34485 RepID=A0ACC2S201_9FUNG|nr:hypothetical protein DSO57_1034385 [Entomophthora muscae]